ncbi:MAG: S9 family peptidase [Armatimonadota bacterium]|nr:S9 family peptidase [Armatimonadota bacterium]MDR7452185.1 S9 family peptidase [Armatimonadota bacterium]MDR7468048.1 S9 family peptidase [Armatimonadota bacterium]MDR7494911.1 S9 family peptidase [Armatimonadota bacterium]MDR7500361.1 S9 family peptidase [Armatimonadota bacterium]
MSGRTITIDDLLALKWIGDPQISPDGRWVVYVQKVADREADTYRSHLWIVPLEGGPARQFTAGGHQDSLPRWSPDGRRIAFLSDRGAAAAEPGARKPKQIYVIPVDGGEATAVTTGNRNPTDLAWSPDGRWIAFAGKPEGSRDDKSDVKVITRVRYKFDGEGYWDGRYKHIFVVPAEGGEVRQITDGEFDHSDPAWSPDGRWIACVANRSDDADYTNVTDIWVFPSAGGEGRRLTFSVGPCAMPAWSPDGARIAYLGHDNEAMSATNTRLWIAPLAGGSPVCVTAGLDRSLAHHIITDMRAHPRVGRPVWLPDGRAVLVLVAEGATNQLARVEVSSGAVTVLTGIRREIYGYDFDRAVQNGVLAVSDPLTPGDLWAVRLDGDALRERRLTAVNADLLDGLVLSRPERFTYEGADGWPVEGWVMRPAGFQEGRRYPAILQIHGGPHGAYGEAFFHEFQVLAAEGFAVVFTNPRGSQGYGQRFTAATHHDWGGKDYEDIMRGLDAALERFPFLDPERLGVAGGSYGGFMTNWVIGHTDRFKAAVTMRSISNHLSQWGTSDLAYMKGFWEFPGDPWESPTWYWERSPLAYVANIRTPLLILHSEMDLRCPMPEAEQLFAALKKLRREVVFVRFPGESHDLSRAGKPAHRLERLRWIVRWFADHLRQPAPQREAVAAGGSDGGLDP